MTWIRVEPDEMVATASMLQAVVDEMVALGGDVRQTTIVPGVPAAAQAVADAVIGVVEAMVGLVAEDLRLHAVDLARRGAAAANDSLTIAASSAGSVGTIPLVGGAGAYLAGTVTAIPDPFGGSISVTGGYLAGSATAMAGGFSGQGGYVAGSATAAPGGFSGQGGYVAGSATAAPGGFSGQGGYFAGSATPLSGLSGANVSGGYYHGGPSGPTPSPGLVGVPGGGGPSAFVGDGGVQGIRNWTTTSRDSMMRTEGLYISPDEYLRRGFHGRTSPGFG